jgi:hypothetical protein
MPLPLIAGDASCAASSSATQNARADTVSRTSKRISKQDIENFHLGGDGVSGDTRTGTSLVPMRLHEATQSNEAALDGEIETKLHHIAGSPAQNRDEMREFLTIMREYQPDASDKQRTAVLKRATPHFLKAYFPTLDSIDGPQREAGQWLNMHNWASDVLALTPTLLAAAVKHVTEKAMRDHLPAGQSLPPPHLAPPFISLVGSGLNIIVNPLLTRRWIQPALTQQRIIRTITPARAGGAVDTDKTIRAMRTATAQARQRSDGDPALEAGTATDTDLTTKLETAIAAYDEASATTRQRRQLYMPENWVRIARSCAIPAAAWMNFGLGALPESRLVPTVLIFQVISYLAAAERNYHWAGPQRDALLRDGALHVDFAASAPAHARRLLDAAGMQGADDEVMSWGRGVYKSQTQVRLEMTQMLVQEQIETAFDDLALLLGIPPGDLARMVALKERGTPSTEIEDRYDTAVTSYRAQHSPESEHLGKTLHMIKRLQGDKAGLQAMLTAAAGDRIGTEWRQFSSDTKKLLSLALSPHETQGVVSRYFHFMYRGANSRIDSIRFAHAVADSVRRDWRNYQPDAFLKYAKAAQMGIGGALVPLIVSAAFGIASALDKPPHIALRIVATMLPFLIYIGCEIHQGTLVNATIVQRQELKRDFPSRLDTDGRAQRHAKQAFFNLWRLPEQLDRSVRGSWARSAANEELNKLRAAASPASSPSA